jgi:hypothetical protein
MPAMYSASIAGAQDSAGGRQPLLGIGLGAGD